MTILIATSTRDFDPTEVAVPWKILRDGGLDICFATDSGKAGRADPRMIEGKGFGVLKPFLVAQKNARDAYQEMLDDKAFLNPISYSEIRVEDF